MSYTRGTWKNKKKDVKCSHEGCITCKIFSDSFYTRLHSKCYNCKYNYKEGTENNWEELDNSEI